METPAPPVLREKHIGKEASAGNVSFARLLFLRYMNPI
jgi:hypothetical protein